MNRRILITEANKIGKNINKYKKKEIKKSILFFGDKIEISVIPQGIKTEILKILKYCLKCRNNPERKFCIKIIVKKLKYEVPHTVGRTHQVRSS